MNATPARLRVSGATQTTAPSLQPIHKARLFIPTDLEEGDAALIDNKTAVTIVKKYKCSACVQFKHGDRSVISYDRLSKL